MKTTYHFFLSVFIFALALGTTARLARQLQHCLGNPVPSL